MPSFTSSNRPDLQANGPIVPVLIAVSEAAELSMREAGQPIPAPIQINALFDTGASGSAIKAGEIAPLGLQPMGIRNINTPSSINVPCPEYAVRVILPNSIVLAVTVIETPLEGQNIEGLLGRDVIAQAVFIYIGYTGTFSFSI